MEGFDGSVELKILDNIAFVTFYHSAGNSFSSQMLQKLSNVIDEISLNDLVKVVVLQSEGKVFCAGASFNELLNIHDFESSKTFFSGFARVINSFRKCKKIILGKVHSKAVGGGVGLIAACDYVFATTDASIKLSEIAIGIGPFVIEPAVSKKIGVNAMYEMALSPTVWKTSDWAHKNGLYNEVFTDIEQLQQYTLEFAKNIATYNQEALIQLKEIYWKECKDWDKLLFERAEISGRLALSEFTKDALSKFKNK